MRLDHLAIVAETLEEGVAWAEERLGVVLLAGGKHEHFGTHNRLLGLADGLYLEVIAVDPDGTSQGPRWFDLDNFKGPPRLANWICEPDDFDAALVHGMKPVSMSRGDLRWDMGAPADGSLPMGGGYPTILRWHSDEPPGVRLPPSGFALEQLIVSHPQADGIAAQLDGVLQDNRVAFRTAPDIRLSATLKHNDRTVTL